MNVPHLLLQTPALADTVSAKKLQALTDSVKSHVDTFTHPDSIAAMTPDKVINNLKHFDLTSIVTNLSSQIIALGLRLLAAILIFYVGKLLINKLHSMLRTIFVKKDVDKSLTTFLLSFIKISLLFLLIITVIGVLGVETSSFIAIFASAGVAIGLALSGTLQNFAGGVLILLIKPYKVGDFIEFGEFRGTVKEIQIFHTIISTINNERIIIPNGGLSTGTVNNYTAEKFRRIEWRVAISYGDSVQDARQAIMGLIAADSRIIKSDAPPQDNDEEATPEAIEAPVAKRSWWRRLLGLKAKAQDADDQPAHHDAHTTIKLDYTPAVLVESLADSSVVLLVRAWAPSADYWNVLFDMNERIYESLPQHGLRFPFPQLDVHLDGQ